MAKPLISTKAACSVVLISISLKVVPGGQSLFRVQIKGGFRDRLKENRM